MEAKTRTDSGGINWTNRAKGDMLSQKDGTVVCRNVSKEDMWSQKNGTAVSPGSVSAIKSGCPS